MNIESIFAKQLTRDINGVVKAEQTDNNSVFVELDEYVVTQELDRHFRNFFETYTPAVKGQNPAIAGKIGVWVSGFFGSGKSHFIKILSYLLENRSVEQDGKTLSALDSFRDKITDPLLFADINSAVVESTEVILFNIDSQANANDRDNAILNVFLKVFNDQIGYCADFPHIAHLERELDKHNQYTTFQEKFAELTGSQWDQERDAYDFYRDEMVQSLSFATGQSTDSTRQWIEQLEQNFPLSIANFCQWVKEYLETKKEGTLLFMVDEVGQFIGKNTQMMLQLQTITENLGAACAGRAWVIVTSQADIDAAIGLLSSSSAQDFSKIQGRFYTRLQLSSSNTSEVIQRRLLEKTEPAREELSSLYAKNGDILRNQLSFDKTTTADLKGYADNLTFVDNYPFVPFHYQLVQKVFESIRTKGATGKHLAMGERSLLDAFQSAAVQIKDCPLGQLVSFHCFYAPIESFLEPAVKRTIDQACEKESLSEFDTHILKTLFLIRYVDVVKSTLDNLVTLTLDCIDADKITLKKQIEDSLIRLERELLIARNGDEYLFLTNEEKEIENEIRHTDVEPSDLTNSLSKLLFNDILKNQTSYRYGKNQKDFRFSRFCNGHPKDGSTLEDLIIKITSPLDAVYSYLSEAQCISDSLEAAGTILIKLSDDKRLWDELTTYIKTDRFLRINSGQRPEQEHLLREKSAENSERQKRLLQDFEKLFSSADIYAIGQALNVKASSPQGIVYEACQYVIDNSFNKMDLLRAYSGDIKRELLAVLTADDAAQLGLDLDKAESNPEALREVEQFIILKTDRSEPVYLKDLLQRFTHRPYGWNEDEILLLIARLALAGKISLSKQNTPLLLKSAYETLTNIRKRGDVRIQRIRQHNEAQLKNAAQKVRNLFNKTFTGQTEKELADLIRREILHWQDELKSFQNKAQTGHYPGKQEIETGLLLIAGLLEQNNSFALIQRFLDDAGKLDEFSEDFEDLDDFYNSQFGTWQQLKDALERYQPNRHVLSRYTEAEQALSELQVIYESPAPYGRLNQVARCITEIDQVNKQVLQDRRDEVVAELDELIKNLTEQLSDLPPDLNNKALYPLQQSKQRVERSQSIHELNSESQQASELEDRAIDILNHYAEQQQAALKIQEEQSTSTTALTSPVVEDTGLGVQPATVPALKTMSRITKKVIIVSPAELFKKSGNRGYLENEQSVDDYLAKLRQSLMDIVAAGDRVRIK